MPKYLFVIHDDVDMKRITGITVRDDSFNVDPLLYKATNSPDLFNTVSELLKSSVVRYNSNHVGELKIEDLKIEKIDPFSIKKMLTIQRGMLLINQRINILSLFGFANFIILNNYMLDAGYFITNENREQKYLEIINTTDKKLIKKLEEYLEALDVVSQDLYWYSHYREFRDAVDSASSEEQLTMAINTFNSLFN
jgi:hypothetical protein